MKEAKAMETAKRQMLRDLDIQPTDEAIAMFITDYKSLWKLVGKTQVVSIEFPVKDGGTRTAVFETGGLDAPQMPGWD